MCDRRALMMLLALTACGEAQRRGADEALARAAQPAPELVGHHRAEPGVVERAPETTVPNLPPNASSEATTSVDAPEPMVDKAPAERIYTVAVLSDLNGSYGSTRYGEEVHQGVRWLKQRVRPDVVLSTGDMVAGQRAGLDYDAMWQAFHGAVTQPLRHSGIPLAPTPGNHDASGYARYQQERGVYIRQWRAHRPKVRFVEDTYYPLHYAFMVGPALFISLDDTQIGPLGGPQRAWLDTVLQAHADAPVKIVYGHLPLYPVSQGREAEALHDPELEAQLVAAGVDLFIAGHHHAYYPGKRGSLGLLSVACLGAGPRKLLGDALVSPRSIVLLRYSARGLLGHDAYGGATFDEVIPRGALPPSLIYQDRMIVRDDL